ncbi:hypothetical protein DFH08DRAFT_812255 [Mycena albidolilacea]|uniref:Uncharacterized protein n=1 Tax=Mycena albidolilacea TaxID=1033008 RepID=A0AAD7EN40_9AGAR|nr:hypothetical protein DFH08DRAFT_812255 [Mycena albidolilacea]
MYFKIGSRYAVDVLWILNWFIIRSRANVATSLRAKILRMSNDPQGAIAVLQRALEAPQTFVQADTLMRPHHSLYFPLPPVSSHPYPHPHVVTLLVTCDSIDLLSHATCYFIAAGCYVSLGSRTKAQELFDPLPELLQREKVGGKDLATEVLIRKHLEFSKEKQKRRGGGPTKFVECIGIGPADELAIFWNMPQRIDDAVAEGHIAELAALTVPIPLLPAVYEKYNVQLARPAFRHFSAFNQGVFKTALFAERYPTSPERLVHPGSIIDSGKRVVVFLDTGAEGEDAVPFILSEFQLLPAFRLPYFPPSDIHSSFLCPQLVVSYGVLHVVFLYRTCRLSTGLAGYPHQSRDWSPNLVVWSTV